MRTWFQTFPPTIVTLSFSGEPIAAFCSSDEEDAEEDALLYLPVAPDIDDPDEGGGPGTSWGALSAAGVLGGEDASGVDNDDIGGGSKKRPHHHSSSNTDSKRKRIEEVNISLPNAPTDSEHPLLNPKMEKPQKLPSTKQGGGGGGGNGGGRGRPRASDDGGGGGGGSRKRKEKY